MIPDCGRRNLCRPLCGLGILREPDPGLRSLRYAHPGLLSVVPMNRDSLTQTSELSLCLGRSFLFGQPNKSMDARRNNYFLSAEADL
jgi:hypothetical protein